VDIIYLCNSKFDRQLTKDPLQLQIVELLPQHYTLLLHRYRYQLTAIQDSSSASLIPAHQHLVADTREYKYQQGSQLLQGSFAWNISMPCDHQLTIQYEASKKFLHRERFESDVSRGLAINPTIISVYAHRNQSYKILAVTAADVVMMPYPDASMPFNVITLVSR
jgi:hypothetical protein